MQKRINEALLLANKFDTNQFQFYIKIEMIIPIRCFSCGFVCGNKWLQWVEMMQNDWTKEDSLDSLGLKRLCCRRMLLTHIDLIDKLLEFGDEEGNGELME